MKIESIDKVRQMTRAELDTAIEWARKEGWNPGLKDADVFWQADPLGYLALEREGADGESEMIGSGSTVSYDGKFGFMGFFIIRPDLRSHGLGRELWFKRRDTLLSRLESDAAIGMDGVFDMQPFYAKGGFKFSHRNLRMQGLGRELNFERSRVRKISQADFESIEKIDKRCFGFDRKLFLSNWLSMPDSKSFCYKNESDYLGFGTIRQCHTGWKIGPLFARSKDVADELFRALNTVAKGMPIFLDAPEINESALALANEYKMTESFGCARMYYGKPPDLPYDEIYGVTTFELG
ncbi:MAG: GNAT family N-acetyltransferase [Cyanobacteria bacterium TGS_CYA1]|nr:GNAT family N-acetyltransferase [Cyanobacteria bacterium TGS_CYA1]